MTDIKSLKYKLNKYKTLNSRSTKKVYQEKINYYTRKINNLTNSNMQSGGFEPSSVTNSLKTIIDNLIHKSEESSSESTTGKANLDGKIMDLVNASHNAKEAYNKNIETFANVIKNVKQQVDKLGEELKGIAKTSGLNLSDIPDNIEKITNELNGLIQNDDKIQELLTKAVADAENADNVENNHMPLISNLTKNLNETEKNEKAYKIEQRRINEAATEAVEPDDTPDEVEFMTKAEEEKLDPNAAKRAKQLKEQIINRN